MSRRPVLLTTIAIMLFAAPSTQLIWSTKDPMPRAQAGGAAALLGNTMIVAGGTTWENGVKLWLTDVQLYESSAAGGTWRSGPPLLEALAYGPFLQSSSALEIFGGAGSATLASRAIWRIDSALARWTKTGETPADHLLGRAARVGRRVFLFGGCADVADLTRCSDIVWMREEPKGAWREVAKLPGGRVSLSASAVLGGRVYLFGGCSMPEPGKVVNHAEAWSFDPESFQFRRLRDIPEANRGLSAAILAARIYLFGGYVDSGFTAAVLSYDTKHDSYANEAAMPAAMSSIEFCARGANTLIGAGGEDRMKGRSARTFEVTLGGAR